MCRRSTASGDYRCFADGSDFWTPDCFPDVQACGSHQGWTAKGGTFFPDGQGVCAEKDLGHPQMASPDPLAGEPAPKRHETFTRAYPHVATTSINSSSSRHNSNAHVGRSLPEGSQSTKLEQQQRQEEENECKEKACKHKETNAKNTYGAEGKPAPTHVFLKRNSISNVTSAQRQPETLIFNQTVSK